eukprot:TRINITY_DN7186_c0_g1_i1.p1 TRINITY_DN7186_c0_g1~~TRINITY_DN7186_c0_g1_i1.p1  ORF type:complete len:1005 (+),score=188.63 TRINITY_DN7186_c0_g1_i1:176-3190(+)
MYEQGTAFLDSERGPRGVAGTLRPDVTEDMADEFEAHDDATASNLFQLSRIRSGSEQQMRRIAVSAGFGLVVACLIGCIFGVSLAKSGSLNDRLASVGGRGGADTRPPKPEFIEAMDDASSDGADDYASDDGPRCPNLHRHSGLIDMYRDMKNEEQLILDLTKLLDEKGHARVLAMAMFTRGLHKGTTKQLTILHMPVAGTRETLLELALSEDATRVDVQTPQMYVRTGDPEMATAVRLGAWSGWEASLPRVVAHCDGLDKHRVTVASRILIRQGFFVEGWHKQIDHVISYEVRDVRAFRDNVDITVEMIVHPRHKPHHPAPMHEAMTVTFSLMRLPKAAMAPRAMDPRIGYFTVNYLDLGQNPEEQFRLPHDAVDTKVRVIQRFHLAELPRDQIRIYIDPTVPSRWRSYFKSGVEAWNEAFAEIGFPDAIRGVTPDDKDWPSDYDAGDARFNTISWSVDTRVTTRISICHAKFDPRSGEVLKGDIIMTSGWIGLWLRDLDLYQPPTLTEATDGHRREEVGAEDGGAAAGDAADMGFGGLGVHLPEDQREEVLGAGLKSIVMHETGHMLGLRHNFKGSLGIPLECTRDVKCSEKEGLSTSVMDYLPMNIPSSGLQGVSVFTPKIGEYDKLAIKYGYSKAPTKADVSPFRPPPFLEATLLAAEKLPFCSDHDYRGGQDPTCEVRDMSADPLEAYKDRFEMLTASVAAAGRTSVAVGEAPTRLGAAVVHLLTQIKTVLTKVSFWLGGMLFSRSHRSSASAPVPEAVKPVPLPTQQKALNMLLGVLGMEKNPLASALEEVGSLITATTVRGGYLPEHYHMSAVNVHHELRLLRKHVLQHLMQMQRLLQVSTASRSAVAGQSKLTGLTVRELLGAVASTVWGKDFLVGSEKAAAVTAKYGNVPSDVEEMVLRKDFVELLRHFTDMKKEPHKPAPMDMDLLSEVLRVVLQLRRGIQHTLDNQAGSGVEKVDDDYTEQLMGGTDDSAYNAFLLHMLDRLPAPGEEHYYSR